MSQGITVSIQAKLEGWKEQLAQLQNAAKKVDLGSDFGKSLSNNIKDLEGRITEMSRHMRQKLTSESNIDSFVRKISEVDEKFQSVGQSLSKIDYKSLDPSYIKSNFSELYKEVEKAEKELAQGIDSAFQKGIASGTKLGNLIEKLGNVDTSKLNIDNIGSTLSAAMQKVQKDVQDSNKELDNLRERLSDLKATKNRLEVVDGIKDVKGTVSDMIGTPEQYGINKSLDTGAVENFVKTVTSKLNGLSKVTAEKRQEIETALENLGKSTTIDEAKTALSELTKAASSASVVRDLGVTKTAVNEFTKNIEIITQNSSQLESRMGQLRESLLANGISEDEVNKLIPTISKDIWAGKFDGAQDAIESAIIGIKAKIQAELPKINEEIDKLTGDKSVSGSIKEQLSKIFTETGTLRQIDASTGWISQLKNNIESETGNLKSALTSLKETLSTEATSGLQNLGLNISDQSAQALLDAAAAAQEYKDKLDQVRAGEQMVGKIQGVVQRWFSVYAAIRMVRQGVQEVIDTISELDKTITNIAIVTDMGQSELWNQMPTYTALAREYAASISGVYEVSQLYYQQGLNTNQVMSLTEQTLKMARISGLDYAQATDYMTNAVRSFKMELTDSQRVVDVYSAVAATSATSVSELATAMSKTASSAEAVGSSFENTTAMMAVMIEATRESAENIGSALKSIISRYGEMKADPSKLIDSEGEAMSLNKVDTALQTVGISIHDAAGQFRDFDDVIMELAEKWDTIDTNTQRYIATIMAGNRQQSRFLALVSSYDRLKEESEQAANAEDASQQQYLKTLDSIDAKQQQLKTSVQDIYTSSGVQNFYKGILDIANNIVVTFDQLSAKMGIGTALAKIGADFTQLAVLATNAFNLMKMKFINAEKEIEYQSAITAAKERQEAARTAADQAQQALKGAQDKIAANQKARDALLEYQYSERLEREKTEAEAELINAQKLADTTAKAAQEADEVVASEQLKQDAYKKSYSAKNKYSKIGMVASAAGMAMTTAASAIDVNDNRGLKASLTAAGSVVSGIGTGLMIGGVPGAIMGTLSALPGILEAIGMASESTEEKVKRLSDVEKESNDARIKANQEYKTLKNEIDELEELSKARYDSADAAQAYIDAANKLAETAPELVSSYSLENGAVIDLEAAYQKLAAARQAADEAAAENASNAVDTAEAKKQQAEEVYGKAAVKTLMNNNYSIDINDFQSSSFNGSNGKVTFQQLSSFFGSRVAQQKTDYYAAEQFMTALGKKDFGAIGNFGTDEQWTKYFQSDLKQMSKSAKLYEQELAQLLDQLFNDLYNTNTKEKNGIVNAQGDIALAERNELTAFTSKQVNALITSADYLNGAPVDYLKDFAYAQEIINNYITKQWDTSGIEDLTEFLDTNEAGEGYKKIIEDIRVFWESLGSRQEDFENVLNQSGQYSPVEFEELLDQYGATGEIKETLMNYYKNAFNMSKFNAAIRTRMSQHEDDTELDIYANNRPFDIYQSFGSAELSNLLKKYDILQKLIDNKNIQLSEGQSILDNYIDAFTQNKGNEDVQKILTNVDFASWSSVTDAIAQLSDATKFNQDDEAIQGAIANLRDISHLIPLNIYTESQTLLKTFTDNLSDFQTAVKNAVKGMDFKQMMEQVEKNGFQVSNFEFKNGKYFAKDYGEYVKQLQTSLLGDTYDNLINEANYRKNTALSQIQHTVTSFDQNGAEIQHLENINWDENTIKSQLHLSDSKYEEYAKEYATKFATTATQNTAGFIEFVYKQEEGELTAANEEAKKYATDVIARSALESGNIEGFLNTAFEKRKWFASGGKSVVMKAIASGDISTLAREDQDALADYAGLIYQTYKDTQTSIASAITTARGGGESRLAVTEANKEILRELVDEKKWATGNVDQDAYITFDIEALKASEDEVGKWIVSKYKNTNDQLNALKGYYDSIYSENAVDSFTKMASGDTVNRNDFIQYLSDNAGKTAEDMDTQEELEELASTYGMAFDAAGNLYVKNYSDYIQALTNDLNTLRGTGASIQQINSVKTKIQQAKIKQEKDQESAFENVIKNYNNITPEIREALANSLNWDIDDGRLSEVFKDNGRGGEEVNISELRNLIQNSELGQEYKDYLLSQFGTITDEWTKVMTDASSLMSKGTTSDAEMKKFTEEVNQIEGINYSQKDLFTWSDTTHNYKLNIDAYRDIITQQAAQMNAAGLLADEEMQKWIDTQLLYPLQEAIDLSGFLSAENKSEGSQAYKKMYDEVKSYLAQRDEAEPTDDDIKNTINKITGGGIDAINEAKALLPDHEFTDDEINQLYYNNVQGWIDAAEELNSGIGTIVSKEAADILSKANYGLTEIESSGNFIITGMGDINKAMIEYYDKIKGTNISMADKIHAAAQAFDAENIDQTMVYSSQATGISSEDFLKMLEAGGITSNDPKTLLDYYKNIGVLTPLANGKYSYDFDYMAGVNNWDKTSEEYIKNRQSYIEFLIASDELINNGLKSAISKLSNIDKSGQIDATALLATEEIGQDEEKLKELLQQYNATYEDDVIKITEATNITGLIAYIASLTTEGGIGDVVKSATKQDTKENKINDGFMKVFSDINNVSDEALTTLFEGLGVSETEVQGLIDRYTQIGANGNRQLIVSQIPTLLELARQNASDVTVAQIEQSIANTADSLISSLNTAGTQLSGINNFADQQKIINQLQDFVQQGLLNAMPDTSSLFQYNSALGATTLTTQGYEAYRQGVINYLQQLGIDLTQAQQQILSQAKSNVKISDYLSASSRGQGSKAYAQLASQMKAVQLSERSDEFQATDMQTYVDQARKQLPGAGEAEIKAAAEEALRKAEETNQEIENEINQKIQSDIDALNAGGDAAIEIMRSYSENGELTKEQVEAAYRAQVQPLADLASQLSSLEKGSVVAENQIEALRTAGFEVNENQVIIAVGNLVTAYQSIYNQMAQTGEATASELNAVAAQVLNAPYTNTQKGVEALNSGARISWDDFIGLYTADNQIFGESYRYNGSELEAYTNDQTVEAEKQRLIDKGAISVNELGQVAILNAQLMAEILNWDTDSDEYKAALSAQHDALIEEKNKLDETKRGVTQLSNLSSAKIGDTINIDTLDESIKEGLGLAGQDEVLVTQELRDTWLKRLDVLISQSEGEYKVALQEFRDQLQSEVVGKATGVQGVISKRVSQSAMKTFQQAAGKNLDVKEFAELYGFQFDELTQEWIATQESYQMLQNYIDMMPTNNKEDLETRNNLQALLNELQSTEENKPSAAIKALLDNETNVSEQMIADFKTQFGDKVNIDNFITTDAQGVKSLNTAGLVDALRNANVEVDKLFGETIQQKADAMVKSVGDVGKYLGGFENLTDQSSFEKQLQAFVDQELISGFDASTLYTTNAMGKEVLSADAYQTYYEGVINYLSKIGVDVAKAQKMLIEQASKNVDISGFISSYASGDTLAAGEKLKSELTAWATAVGRDVDTVVETYTKALSQGGSAAISVATTIKGRELTTDEASTLYKAEIDRYMAAMDELQSSPGSVISETAAEILGISNGSVVEIGESGVHVVQSAINLEEAYRSLLEKISASGEATLAQLNQVNASILSASKQNETFGLDLLSSAGGISFSQIADLFTQQGRVFNEEIYNAWKDAGLVEELGGDQFRILDFDAFAKIYDIPTDSIRYLQEYSNWVDNAIKTNQDKQTNLQSQLSSIANAKIGDQLNVSYLVDFYGELTGRTEDQIANDLLQFGVSLSQGILTISDSADLVGLTNSFTQEAVRQGLMLSDQAAELQAQAQQTVEGRDNEANNAFRNAFADLSEVSDDALLALYKSIDDLLNADGIKSYSDFVNEFTKIGANGKKSFDTSTVKSFLEKYGNDERIGEEVFNYLKESIMAYGDSAVATLSTYTGYISGGTTNMADMQKFVNDYAETVGEQINIDQAFQYDTGLEAFTLDASIYQKYAEAQKQKLEEMGLNADQAVQAMIGQLQSNIDVSGYLSKDVYDSQNIINFARQIRTLLAAQGDEVSEQTIATYISRLRAGGDDAVTALQELKGADVSAEEISAVYRAQVDRLSEAATQLSSNIGATVSGEALRIMEAAGYEITRLPDGSGVIDEVGDMVTAYLALYQQMESNAASTTTDLNDAYAQMLTAMDQRRMDTLETLENASGMSYDSFSKLLSSYDVKFADVMETAEDWGVQSTGFGKIRIVDFQKFADMMNFDIDSPEYAEAYSKWVDSMAELQNAPMTMMQNAADQLKGLTEAKAGQAINVSYLDKQMNGGLEEIAEKYGLQLQNGLLTLNQTTNIPGLITEIANKAAEAGQLLPEQLAELTDAVESMLSDITNSISGGIEGKLSNADAQQLNTWYREQQEIAAKEQGLEEGTYTIKDLDFSQTADGLRLSNDQATELYKMLSKIDGIQGEVAFKSLKDNMIATNDNFKSVSSNTAYIKKLKKDIATLNEETERYAKVQEVQSQYDWSSNTLPYEGYNGIEAFNVRGNVDNLYTNARWVRKSDGTKYTKEGTTFNDINLGKEKAHVLFTPILDGATSDEQVLDTTELTEYYNKLMAKHPVSIEALLELDAEGIQLDNGQFVSNMIMDIKDATKIASSEFNSEAATIKNYTETWENLRDGIEAPDNSKRIASLEEELSLAEKINSTRSAATYDESFNFMSNSIPEAQNNPLNYFSNWSDAIQKLNTAMKTSSTDSNGTKHKGLIDYTDYYNIITELNNLAGLSGNIELAGVTLNGSMEAAAELINKGCAALTTTDAGDIAVSLGDIGIDFEAGSGAMSDGIESGIKSLAASQVEMLDSLISLLEVIVAMEALGDIDVEGNGIDLGDVFKITWDEESGEITSIDGYTDAYNRWRENIIEQISQYNADGSVNEKFNKDLADAMGSIKINGETLSKLISWDATQFNANPEMAKSFTSALAALYRASISDNYDLDNLEESIKQELQASGVFDAGVMIDVGDVSFALTGNTMVRIDWSNETVKAQAEQAIANYITNHEDQFTWSDDTTIQQKIADLLKHLNDDNITVEETAEITAILDILQGKVTVQEVKDKNGKTTGWEGNYKNQKFTVATQEEALAIIAEAERMELNKFNAKISATGEVTGEVNIKGATITVKQGAFGTDLYISRDKQGNILYAGHDYNTAKGALASIGLADKEQAGETYFFKGEELQVQYDQDLGITYIFNKTTGLLEYDGKTFADKKTLVEYINYIDPILKSGDWKVSKDGDFKIYKKGKAKIIYNVTKGTYTYAYGNQTFNSAQEYAEWMDAVEAAEQQGNEVTLDADGNYTVNFIKYGQEVKLTYLASGELLYEVTVPGKGTVSANSDAALRLALAGLAALDDGEVQPTKDQTATVTINGQKITLKYDGTTVTAEPAEGEDVDEKLLQQFQEGAQEEANELGSDPVEVPTDKPINITSSNVNLIVDSNASVSLDNGGLLGKLTSLLTGQKGFTVNDTIPLKATKLSISADATTTTTFSNTATVPEVDIQKVIGNAAILDITSKINRLATSETAPSLTNSIPKVTGKVAVVELTHETLNVTSIAADIVKQLQDYFNANPVSPVIGSSPSTPDNADGGGGKTTTENETINTNTTINETENKTTNTITITTKVEKGTSEDDLAAVKSAATEAQNTSPVEIEVSATGTGYAVGQLAAVRLAANLIPSSKTVDVSLNLPNNYQSAIQSFIDALSKIKTSYTITFKGEKTGNWPSDFASGNVFAQGNVGPAMAGGNTLMGELGPELVVQQGRYFIAGQHGPEFVSLSNDAIVFNHLQTEQLLTKGMSPTRGRAVTNERVATAFAEGNLSGPAMASASAALAMLKQLRSMWQSLAGSSVKDLAGTGGSGGGGGGGQTTSASNFVYILQKWYDWLQKIAELEEEITYQETLRSKIQSDFVSHGQDVTKSYLTSLKALEEEAKVQQSLVDTQQQYFDERRNYFNSSDNPFSVLYDFDETGQLKYKDGALAQLSALMQQDQYGKGRSSKDIYYDILKINENFKEYMNYDSSGNEIDWYDDEGNLDESAYDTAVQAFWDKIDADKEEMQSLHDSIEEHRDAVLESQESMNTILKSIEDNQISVEGKVLAAVEDLRQRAIDDAQDERDAIEAASTKLIEGLSEQLENERQMYENQENADELAKLQRQLAILQRSGGSASQIASLQSQISDKQQEAYFDAQQEEIDALQDAADTQIEKLDEQISLMNEELEYEKEHGLLWNAVYEVMKGSPEEIADYIYANDSSYWGKSPTELTKDQREILFDAQQYVEFRNSVKGGLDQLIDQFTTLIGNSEAATGKSNATSETDLTLDFSSVEGADTGSSGSTETKSGAQVQQVGIVTDGSSVTSNEDHWYQKGSDWYYTYNDKDLTGWLQYGNEWFFFDETGKMFENTTKIIDGTLYNFNEKGYANNLGPATSEDTTNNNDTGISSNSVGTTSHSSVDLSELIKDRKNGTTKTYDYGGVVDETEMALVHAKEGVLTEKQMSILRNDIMGSSSNSLVNLLLDFRSAYEGLGSAAGNVSSSNESFVIERAEVNMNVASIASDYDAQRAGEQVMDEILNIAKKTSGWNRIGG